MIQFLLGGAVLKFQAVTDELIRIKEETEKGIQKEYDRIQKEQAKK